MISSNGCILHEEDKQVVGNVEQMVKTEKDIGHGLSREGKDMKESKKKQPVSANNV